MPQQSPTLCNTFRNPLIALHPILTTKRGEENWPRESRTNTIQNVEMGRGAQAILTAISLLFLLEMKGLSRINNYVEVSSAAFDLDPPPTAVPIMHPPATGALPTESRDQWHACGHGPRGVRAVDAADPQNQTSRNTL